MASVRRPLRRVGEGDPAEEREFRGRSGVDLWPWPVNEDIPSYHDVLGD